MKWNWGTGIFIFIVAFLMACIAFVIYAQSQRWSMVEDDYYPKTLRHEEKMVKMRNANGLSERLQVKFDNQFLTVQFPADFKGKTIDGSIHIYRPSDETLDVMMPIAADTSQRVTIPMSKLSRGKYIVKVDWTSEGVAYYKENELFIP